MNTRLFCFATTILLLSVISCSGSEINNTGLDNYSASLHGSLPSVDASDNVALIAQADISAGDDSHSEGTSPEARGFTIFLSSNTVSNFTPCGCHSGKWGGMPRRGTIINEIRDAVPWDVILIDTGDVTNGSSSEMQKAKDDYIWQAYQVFDYDLVNVGVNELRLETSDLMRFVEDYDIPFTSANLYSTGAWPDLPIEQGIVARSASPLLPVPPETIFEPYRIVEVENLPGFKVGIISMLIQPGGRLNPMNAKYSFEPYEQALNRTVNILNNQENVDMIILACDSDNFDNIDIPEVFGEIDIVIGGNQVLQRSPNAYLNPLNPLHNPAMAQQQGLMDEFGNPLPMEPVPTPILLKKGANRARLVTRLDITLNEQNEIVDYYSMEIRVDDTHIDDPNIADISRGYDTQILATELVNRLSNRFVGAAACEECHPGYVEVWRTHGHFNSFNTIADMGYLHDRECTRCHALGFSEEPRLLTYDLIPDHLRNLGCEGCHTNGKQHITIQNHLASLSPEQRANSNTADAMVTTEMYPVSCSTCHSGIWADNEVGIDAMFEESRALCQSVAGSASEE